MPIGPYEDFEDCVRHNQDVDNPEAFCAWLEQQMNADDDLLSSDDMRLQIVPVTSTAFADDNGDGIDDVTGQPVDAPEIEIEIEGPEEEMVNPIPVEDRPEEFHTLLVVEGVWTGDGRYIDEGALTWRPLPLPLMGLDKTTEAHDDARLIGNITRIERDGRELHGYGNFVATDDEEVCRLQDLVRSGDLRGVSVDLDAMEYELVLPSDMVTAAIDPNCPPATGDIGLNIKNRQNAIDTAAYGPLNPAEPNDSFWQDKADRWKVTIDEAKNQRCGSCAMFVQTPEMLSCIEQGIAQGGSSEEDAWAAIDAGDLGYCEAFDFKCAALRTCDAWVTGGPITESAGPAMAAEDVEEEPIPEMEEFKIRVTAATIMGATVVPFPAFQEAFIESIAAVTASLLNERKVSGFIHEMQSFADIDFTPPQGARDEAAKGLEWRSKYNRGGTAVGVARARDISNGKSLSPDTVNRMVSYFARHEVDKQGEGWSPDEDGFPSAGRIAWALWGGDAGRAWANKIKGQMDVRQRDGSVVASAHPIAAPLCPPAAWFADPNLKQQTPMTITDEGRLFGHVATWGSCHIGFSDQCVTPPRSKARYQHYLTGEILCDGGERLPVGQITMDTGHAPLNANGARALAHYDNTGTAIADVTVGEDAYGIWMAGALRPNVDPVKVRGLMASDVSGDWRRIGGNLELVGVLAVNVPGFPKARIQVREAEGVVASLIASLPPEPHEEPKQDADIRKVVDRLAKSIGRSADQRKAELARRVKGI